jgi:hypothetical protein
MFSFKQFLLEGGKAAERQEQGFIAIIKKYAKQGPISVNQIKNVVDANKMQGLNALNTEPYTDVVLTLKNGSTINVSLKGGSSEGVSSAPSIGGGGLAGLQTLVPDIISRFLNKANTWYKRKGYKRGDAIPDVYGMMSENDVELVLRGNEAMGGPVDFMYVGPMDVKGTFSNNTLKLNGVLTDTSTYAKKHSIYFRIRKRREDQTYEPDLRDKEGNPLILGKSPSKGDSGRRIVLVDRVPASANIVKI